MSVHRDPTTEPAPRTPGGYHHALLVTHDTTGPRRTAYERLADQATIAFGTAYHLSGGADDDAAVDAGLHNVLHRIVPGITAFALHHLGALLPDLTAEQWQRLDQAAVELDLEVCEILTDADEPDTAPEQGNAEAPAIGAQREER